MNLAFHFSFFFSRFFKKKNRGSITVNM